MSMGFPQKKAKTLDKIAIVSDGEKMKCSIFRISLISFREFLGSLDLESLRRRTGLGRYLR